MNRAPLPRRVLPLYSLALSLAEFRIVISSKQRPFTGMQISRSTALEACRYIDTSRHRLNSSTVTTIVYHKMPCAGGNARKHHHRSRSKARAILLHASYWRQQYTPHSRSRFRQQRMHFMPHAASLMTMPRRVITGRRRRRYRTSASRHHQPDGSLGRQCRDSRQASSLSHGRPGQSHYGAQARNSPRHDFR